MLQECAYPFMIDPFGIVTSSASTMRITFYLPRAPKIPSQSRCSISYHDMVDDTAHKYEFRVIRRSFLAEIGEYG